MASMILSECQNGDRKFVTGVRGKKVYWINRDGITSVMMKADSVEAVFWPDPRHELYDLFISSIPEEADIHIFRTPTHVGLIGVES